MVKKHLNSLYLHFPFCAHLCNYCDFYKKVPTTRDEIEGFQKFLVDSWEIHQNWIESVGYQWKPLQTFYLGGGTPSLWGEQGASFLSDFFCLQKLELDSTGEHTMEVNPGSHSSHILKAWKNLGINRFSLGLQSLNEDFLKILDRVHSLGESFDALELLATSGERFSVDFMLGLPFSSVRRRDVLKELEQVLSFSPTHISLYILTAKKNYSLKNDLPAEEWVEREFLEVSQFLRLQGFRHYEVSNFALPGHESRHNLRYWNLQTVAALGRSATGFLCEEKIRYQWRAGKKLPSQEKLEEKAFRLEQLYMGLRTSSGIRLGQFFSSKDLEEIIPTVILPWKEKKLAYYRNGAVCLAPAGFLLLDSLVGQLLGYELL